MLKLPLTDDEFELDMINDTAKNLLRKKLVPDEYRAQLQAHLFFVPGFPQPKWLPKLLEAGADINFVYPGYGTALSCAAADNQAETVELLLKAAADPTIPSGKRNPLTVAIEHQSNRAVLPLLRALPPKSISKAKLNSLLIAAVVNKEAELTRWLLDHGADVETTKPLPLFGDVQKATLLMYAAFENDFPTCEVLLAAGADINAKDEKGNTALSYATESVRHKYGGKKMIAWLEKKGAVVGKAHSKAAKPTPGSALGKAAESAEFQRVLQELKDLTKKKANALEGHEDTIEGAYGFLVSEKQSRQIVEQKQTEYVARGAFIFHGEDLTGKPGPCLGVVATSDPFAAVTAIGTEGPNENVYNADLVKWLKQVMKQENGRIVGLAFATIEVVLGDSPRDAMRLAQQIQKIASAAGDDPAALAKKLETDHRFTLWWG